MKKLLSILTLSAALTLSFCLPVYASYSVPPGSINTAKLANGAVTQAKLAARATGTSVAAGGVAISASSGPFDTTSATYVAVTNLSVTITTTGRPVMVMLVPDPALVNTSSIGIIRSGSSAQGSFQISRGGSPIAQVDLSNDNGSGSIASNRIPPGAMRTLDVIAAGTYTYTVEALAGSGSTAQVRHCDLVAYEL